MFCRVSRSWRLRVWRGELGCRMCVLIVAARSGGRNAVTKCDISDESAMAGYGAVLWVWGVVVVIATFGVVFVACEEGGGV